MFGLVCFLGGGNKQKSKPRRLHFKEQRENSQFHKLPKTPRELRPLGGEPDRQKDCSFSLRTENSGEKNVFSGGQQQQQQQEHPLPSHQSPMVRELPWEPLALVLRLEAQSDTSSSTILGSTQTMGL